MKRRILVLIALLVTWACYGLVMLEMAAREASRCHQFGDLVAECFSPFARVFSGISLVFLLSTIALAFFGLRFPSNPDKD